MISIPHGWDEANANVLTDDANLDPVTGFPADRCLLARIVKKVGGLTKRGEGTSGVEDQEFDGR